MIIKMSNGTFMKEEEVNITETSYKKVPLDDVYLINNFFEEKFIGVFDRDTFTFINTNIKYEN